MEKNDMKYFIYCRKSTESEDRQILSLPAQQHELDEYAKKMGLEVVDRFVESASAYKPGRPEFNKMLDRIEKGDADGFIVWQYNRISRNPLDAGRIVYMIDTGALKEVRTPTGVTVNSGNSKMMLGMDFLFSKKTSDDNSESVKRGNKEKILRGWSVKRYAGYKFVEDPTTGEKILAVDPERFPLIKKAIAEVLNYKSPPRVFDMLNGDWGYRTSKTRRSGNRPMSISNFYKILHNDFYSGWIYTADGQRVKGKHEAMISDRDYEKVQIILGGKGSTRPQTVNLPYRGILRCGACDSAICLEEKFQVICPNCKNKFAYRSKTNCPDCNKVIAKMKNPKWLHYTYAHCIKKKDKKCTQKGLRLELLEKQIQDYLSTLEISPRVEEWVLKQLKNNTQSQIVINDQAQTNLNKALEDTRKQLEGLLVQYTQPENSSREIISTEAYMKRKCELEKTITGIEEKLADLSQSRSNFMGDTEARFDFAVTAVEAFNNGNYETRTSIMRNLGSNLKLLDKKVLMDEDILHMFIRKANTSIREYTVDKLEPEKSIDLYEQTGVESQVFSILRG